MFLPILIQGRIQNGFIRYQNICTKMCTEMDPPLRYCYLEVDRIFKNVVLNDAINNTNKTKQQYNINKNTNNNNRTLSNPNNHYSRKESEYQTMLPIEIFRVLSLHLQCYCSYGTSCTVRCSTVLTLKYKIQVYSMHTLRNS